MRIPRPLPPLLLATALLALGLNVARLPEYDAGGRGTMVLVSFIASTLLGGFAALYVYIFKPRLGAPTGHVLLSLVVFALATVTALVLPKCPSDPAGNRCTPTDAVANGFSIMLVSLCFSVVVLLWFSSKRSTQALIRAFRSLSTATKKSGKRPSNGKKRQQLGASGKGASSSVSRPTGSKARPGRSRRSNPK